MSEVSVGAFGGRMNPEQLVLDLMPKLRTAQQCVVVFLDEHDYVQTYWSNGSNIKAVGMVQVAAQALIGHGYTDEPPPEKEEGEE